ncbi:response regulator [candidate division WWE3 bacterium]|nr:response regulator [candidate division WWE3 bacterium]
MLLGKKILLVEDDDFIRELYEIYLKESSYTVVGARTGQEGVDKFKEEIFDLVLLDILLPEKDGITVLQEIKGVNDKVPVVMLTNLAQEEMIKKAFDLGAVGYLLKSRIAKKDLLREVEGFLSSANVGGDRPA